MHLGSQRRSTFKGATQTATAFASASHHAWMAEQLGCAERVLELGCGSVQGILALATSGRQVIALDSNQYSIAGSLKVEFHQIAPCARLRITY